MFNFKKLDQRTRTLMVEEIDLAIQNNKLYFSTRFNDRGRNGWPGALRKAAESSDSHRLAFDLQQASAMKHMEGRATPSGGYTTAHVPDTAAETLADGQFNRFYIAAICRRAIEDNVSSVIVYRAKFSQEPRPESAALEGAARNPKDLLEEVRDHDTSLKCDLLKPNSGLSIDY
jgi:hypothetical protein